jgi:hypothetical protein
VDEGGRDLFNVVGNEDEDRRLFDAADPFDHFKETFPGDRVRDRAGFVQEQNTVFRH